MTSGVKFYILFFVCFVFDLLCVFGVFRMIILWPSFYIQETSDKHRPVTSH
jgi:hypothetical protein